MSRVSAAYVEQIAFDEIKKPRIGFGECVLSDAQRGTRDLVPCFVMHSGGVPIKYFWRKTKRYECTMTMTTLMLIFNCMIEQ